MIFIIFLITELIHTNSMNFEDTKELENTNKHSTQSAWILDDCTAVV